jgi:hypothetical protein
MGDPRHKSENGDDRSGRSVASIIAHEVLSQINDISRANAPVAQRRTEAKKRVVLFKTDLTNAGYPPGLAESIEGNLRRHLEDALESHEMPEDELSIFVAALDALTGPED